jgi:hypothetical protein
LLVNLIFKVFYLDFIFNEEQEQHHIVEHQFRAIRCNLFFVPQKSIFASIPARLSSKSFFIFYRSVDYALVFNAVIFHFSPNTIKKHDFGGK